MRESYPYDNRSFVSNILMLWNIPLIKAFRREAPTFERLPEVPQDFEFDTKYEKLREYWAEEQEKESPSFLRAYLRTAWRELLYSTVLISYMFLANVIQSLVIYFIILYLKDDEAPEYEGVLLCLLFIVHHFLAMILNNRGCFLIMMLSGKTKCWITMLIGEKILKASSIHLNSKDLSSKILNILGNDIELIELMILFGPLPLMPLALLAGVFLVYWFLGFSGLIGILFVFSQFLVVSFLNKSLSKIRAKLAAISDSRVRIISNIIEGIKIIKLYTWENPILNLVYAERANEIKQFIKMSYYQIASKGMNIGIIASSILVTFLVYVHSGNELKSELAFAAISIYFTLNTQINYFGALGSRAFFLLLTTFRRITDILCSEEVSDDFIRGSQDTRISVSKGAFSWGVEDRGRSFFSFQGVEDVNFTLQPGEVIMVAGPVGSGKTSLLLGLMNEVYMTQGEMSKNGSISYCPDTAWIIPASLRENILMGKELDETYYEYCLEASCLQKDLDQMDNGDQTLIGDKGVTLSGGQKARICFARALYANSEIVLLDDPLSAVDSEVCQQLVQSIIELKKQGKSVILTTHQVQALPFADRVILLNEGKQVFEGLFQSIKERADLYSMVGDVEKSHVIKGEEVEAVVPKSNLSRKQTVKQLVESEERAKGSVPLKLYWEYIKLGYKNAAIAILCLIALVLSQVFVLGIYYFVSILTEANDQEESVYVYVAIGLIVCTYAFSTIRFIVLYIGLILANETMHNQSIKAITKTESTFFDKNPAGRILNRFTKDTIITDENLLYFSVEFMHNTLQLLGNFILIIIVSPLSLIALLILVLLLTMSIKYILPVSKELRKLELVSKSPVLTSVTSMISGIVSIRSLGAHEKFLSAVKEANSDNLRSYISYHTLLRYLQVITDSGSFAISSVNLISIIALKGFVSPELAAMTLALVISSAGYSNFWSKTLVELDNNMASPQRLFEYKNLKREGKFKSDSSFMVSTGKIEFCNVYMKYQSHLPYVLVDFSCTIQPQQKIGIVGRTGSGKSSLLQALFRLVNPTKGQILIDGQDHMSAGLHELRSQMSVIPQFPFIFKGSIRENLDPLNQFSDSDIIRVLRQVNLYHLVDGLSLGLSTQIQSEEFNLSAGQKQLICLGRAILRMNKIVVMDEATANVDHETDKCMQEEIRNSFGESTVLVIAHRLRTIIDSDLIIVVDEGTCKEVGTPAELAFDSESKFAAMIRHTGEQEAAFLLSKLN